MERIGEEEYLLSTGKMFYPNRGIIGLTEADGFGIYDGYDGCSYIKSVEWADVNLLTREEAREIAVYMVSMWERFIKSLGDSGE